MRDRRLGVILEESSAHLFSRRASESAETCGHFFDRIYKIIRILVPKGR